MDMSQTEILDEDPIHNSKSSKNKHLVTSTIVTSSRLHDPMLARRNTGNLDLSRTSHVSINPPESDANDETGEETTYIPPKVSRFLWKTSKTKTTKNKSHDLPKAAVRRSRERNRDSYSDNGADEESIESFFEGNWERSRKTHHSPDIATRIPKHTGWIVDDDYMVKNQTELEVSMARHGQTFKSKRKH